VIVDWPPLALFLLASAYFFWRIRFNLEDETKRQLTVMGKIVGQIQNHSTANDEIGDLSATV